MSWLDRARAPPRLPGLPEEFEWIRTGPLRQLSPKFSSFHQRVPFVRTDGTSPAGATTFPDRRPHPREGMEGLQMSTVMKRKVIAMTVAASLLALLALTSQADAQDYPELWADPASVDGPGSYSFTLTGSGWSPGLLLYVFPCSIEGDQITTVTPTAEVTARVYAVGDDDCLDAPIGSTAYVGGDGTFSVTVTVDVTAN